MHISWSACDPEVESHVREVLRDASEAGGLQLVQHFSSRRLSQFEHYRELVRAGQTSRWVIFSDDDDDGGTCLVVSFTCM